MQQSRREEALQQYRAALGVAQRFAESDANNLVWQKNLVAAYVKVGDALAAAEDRNQALEPYKTALARAEELTVKYPKNADFAAQHQSIKTKIEQLEPQLATEPRQ
jgi:hypothetical protein